MAQKSRLKRCLEAVAVFCHLYSFYLAPVLGPLLVYYLFFHTYFWPTVPAYIVWMYLDRDTSSTSGRTQKCLRNMPSWKHVRDYFPQEMVKTVDLDLSANHLLCFFPHGILATASICHFANDKSQMPKLFSTTKIVGFTLNLNFYVPFFRELTLGYGMLSISKDSMERQLRGEKGKLFCMYPGGSAEAAKSEPGKYRLALKNRKGFIKIAIRTGTHLVPVISFGETDLFDHRIPQRDSFLGKVQVFIRKTTGVAICFFSGQGFLGMLPYRKPVTSVVGKPVLVTKNENPSQEEIDRKHKEFVEALTQLFEKNKAKYIASPETTHLSIED